MLLNAKRSVSKKVKRKKKNYQPIYSQCVFSLRPENIGKPYSFFYAFRRQRKGALEINGLRKKVFAGRHFCGKYFRG